MRRTLMAAGLLIIACGAARAHEADQYMVIACGFSPKVTDCEQTKTQFRATYKAAFKNDIDAQRRLALQLWKGRSDVVVAGQWRDSCAWHMVIIAMASPKITESDFSNMRTVCALLTPDQVAVAKNDASNIGRRILAGGKIDDTISRPNPKLDGTAERLD